MKKEAIPTFVKKAVDLSVLRSFNTKENDNGAWGDLSSPYLGT
jgi:hypothetical protein